MTAPLMALALAALVCSASAQMLVNPCLSAPYNTMTFCNASEGLDARVEDAIKRMTLAEKIDNMDSSAHAIKSLGLPGYNWWSEATHGISHVKNDATLPGETNFALPITTAASFNRSLWKATGQQIGVEARAFMNAGNAYSTYWAPVINLVRDPRWGRNIETMGEDPYLTGQYAINFVRGMQDYEDDPTHILASACCKHYVANSMESTKQNGVSYTRHDFNAIVSPRDLVDTYMAPFQDCVEQGRVTGLMCSYNEVNGVPSCANDWLLTTVARGQWEFDGYVTSDCDADGDVFNTHHYEATKEEVVRDVLRAGTDIDCTRFVGQNAQSALDKGLITEGDLDDRLRKSLRVRMRLGHFDPPTAMQSIQPSAVCTAYSKNLARHGAIQGSVLLKNDGPTLPLSSDTVKNVAVIGPNANLSKAIAGYYGSTATCDTGRFWNMVDAVAQYASVTYANGVPDVRSNDTSSVAAAAKMAAAADQVVMAVGQDGTIEHEGHDRVSIALSDGQTTLIRAVAAAAKKPIVVVILTGGAVDVTEMLANPKIGAVLHVGQPSVTVLGVGDLIFGKFVPAGRMIQTVYPASFANEVSIFDMGMRPGPSNFPRPDCPKPMAECPNATNPGRTYRFYTGHPVVPFGYGLSYTTFSYSTARLENPATVSLAPLHDLLGGAEGLFPKKDAAVAAQFVVNVTNTGKIDADDVVLGFVTPPGAGSNGVALKQLFGFERVHVKAGETVTVYLAAGLLDFTVTGEDGKRTASAGEYTVSFGVPESLSKGMGYAEHTVRAV